MSTATNPKIALEITKNLMEYPTLLRLTNNLAPTPNQICKAITLLMTAPALPSSVRITDVIEFEWQYIFASDRRIHATATVGDTRCSLFMTREASGNEHAFTTARIVNYADNDENAFKELWGFLNMYEWEPYE